MSVAPRTPAPTIVDVAERAGVSMKTVSRVVNNEAGVREATREQVLKAVAELKYRPQLSARSLAGARSFLIGVLYYDVSAAFVARVQEGAARRCREVGYHVVVESHRNDAPDIAAQVERMVAALRPDGLILTPPFCDNAGVVKVLEETQTPFVLMSPGRASKSRLVVRMDDVHAAEEVTNLLISLGHERIAFVLGPDDQVAGGQRYKGFAAAMKSHGLTIDPELVCPGNFTYPSGVAAAHHLLSGRQRPTAVFAANDDMALGVLATAQRLGLQVPGDLSVAGFDDSPAASLIWPHLTTVRQPVEEMARVAVDLLIGPPRSERSEAGAKAPLADGAGMLRVIPHQLVVRDSTTARAGKAAYPPRKPR